jgi:transcriptional regulator with XRE-family HTH domain
MVSAAQLRAGRHLLGLSQVEVAQASKLSLPTVKRAESGRDVSVSAEARGAIKSVLEAAGLLFIDQNGNGPGVRLRDRTTADE